MENNFNVTIVCLIYRSPIYLIGFYRYLMRYTPEIKDRSADFYFIANSPNLRTLLTLKILRIKHYVYRQKTSTKDEMLESKTAAPEYLKRVYGAYNYGARLSTTKNVILVNSDMVFSEGWLKSMLSHGENSLVSANLVEREHPKFSTFPGAIQENFGSNFLNFHMRSWNRFVKNTRLVGGNISRAGGSYMPTLFQREWFGGTSGFHEGNIGNGIDLENVEAFADEYFFRQLRLLGIGHITDLNAFCYHFKEGEREMGIKVFIQNRVMPHIHNFRLKRMSQAKVELDSYHSNLVLEELDKSLGADIVNGVPIADWNVYKSSSNLENFWESSHKSDNSFWTSGTDYSHIKNIFNLPENFEGKKILVVGVGQGTEIKGVIKSRGIVSGLDISENARMKWESLGPMFSWDTIEGNFDYILMHLVAQHLSDETCREYINILSSHLTTRGKLIIQFSSPLGHVPENSSEDIETLKGGGNSRSLERILGLYPISNQYVVKARIASVYPEHSAVHIVVTSSTH